MQILHEDAERRNCQSRPSIHTEESDHGTRTAHQRPDDRDARPAPDVQVAQVRGGSGPWRRPQRRRGRDLRLPRPERGRQDDDPAHARDAAHAHVGRGDGRGRGPPPRAPAGPRADRLRPPGRFDRSGRDRTRRARPPGPALRHEQVRCPGARRRGAGGPRPRSGRRSHDEHVLGRHEAPARRRPRHRPQAVGPVPRRAHDRSRPPGTGPDVGRDPPPARGRHDGLPDHALPRGGRRAGRPARDHRPRGHRRRRHRRRPEAPGGRRRRDARRQRGDRARARSRPAPVVRARGDQRGRRRPALRRPWRDGRAAPPPRPRWGRAGGVLDRPPPARASTTSSSSRPVARCATKRPDRQTRKGSSS